MLFPRLAIVTVCCPAQLAAACLSLGDSSWPIPAAWSRTSDALPAGADQAGRLAQFPGDEEWRRDEGPFSSGTCQMAGKQEARA